MVSSKKLKRWSKLINKAHSKQNIEKLMTEEMSIVRRHTEEMSITTRPFHESIVMAIKRLDPRPSTGGIFDLFELIKVTKIPKGHDEIITAIDDYFCFPGATKYSREIREVEESLIKQKLASQNESCSEKEGINLDELQNETEKLLALLKDRQYGTSSWNSILHERLKRIHRMLSEAL